MTQRNNTASTRHWNVFPMRAFIVALLSGIFTEPLYADSSSDISLQAENVQLLAFDSVSIDARENSRLGIIETFSKPGHIILLAEMELKTIWTEETSRLSIPSNEIKLVDSDENEMPAIGHYRNGIFQSTASSIMLRRDNQWPDTNPTVDYNVAYLVPIGSGPFTLNIGSHLSLPVQVPENISKEPHITDKMSVTITSAKLVDHVQSQFTIRRGDNSPTEVSSPGNVFLEVTFEVTPNDYNGSFRDRFFWLTDWFGIRYNGDSYSHTIGEAFMGGLSKNVSHNTRFHNDVWQTGKGTFYFPVSPDISTFKLLCLMHEVAQGTIER